MRDYLFFDGNRLQKGFDLKGGKNISYPLAVFYARQLVNAGFYFKKTDKMPLKLSVRSIAETEHNYLFLKEEPEYGYFDERRYLELIKDFFHSLILGEERKKNETVSSTVKKFSTKFAHAIDNLDNMEYSLTNFSFLLEELDKREEFDYSKLLFFSLNTSIVDSQKWKILILPDYDIVSAILDYLGVSAINLPEQSVPFGSYNRFVSQFFFLNLPVFKGDSLPNWERFYKIVERELKSTEEEIIFVEKHSSLDWYSLKIFEKLLAKIPNFKLIVISDKPFSSQFNRYLEDGAALLFNPEIESNLLIENRFFPDYHFGKFLARNLALSNNSFIPFFFLLENGECENYSDYLDSLGIEGEEKEYVLERKSYVLGELKGIFRNSSFAFFRDIEKDLSSRAKKVFEKLKKEKLENLIGFAESLKREKDKASLAEFAESRSNLPDFVKGILWYCADNFSRALRYFDFKNPELAPFITKSFYFLGELDKLKEFCEKENYFDEFYTLAKAITGEEIEENKLSGYPAFEYAVRFRKLDFLENLLKSKSNRDLVFYKYNGIKEFYYNPSANVEEIFSRAVKIAREENNFLEQALIYKHIGNAYYYQNNFFKARDYYLRALKIAVSIENTGIYSDIEYNLSHVDINLCHLDSAYKYFLKLLAEYEKKGELLSVLYVLKALTKINAFASRFEEAEKYALKALEIASSKGYDSELTQIYFLLITVYLDKKQFDKSNYYLRLFEETSDLNLFKGEIIPKKVEYFYQTGELEKARHFFSQMEPEGDNILSKYLYKWFELLLYERPLAEIYDFYMAIEDCPLKHMVYLGKFELLKRYEELGFVLEEEKLKKDYNASKLFNAQFASLFREVLIKRKKRKFDSSLFSLMEEILEQARNAEVYSLRRSIEKLGEWAGLNSLEIVPANSDYKGLTPLVYDRENRLCLLVDGKADPDFIPLFSFVLNMLSSTVKFVADIDFNLKWDFECSYLNQLIGQSEKMVEVKKEIAKVADFSIPVLILGESGTGKELVAKALHYCSRRKRKPFVPINCAAIPENLLESELFGYEKGAFSGASDSKKGLLETAGDGTVFLDEIGEMPLKLQAKLLRVLQEREFSPLGSNKIKKVNARFVFATNKDLRKLVKEKQFREDLYFRIAGYIISLPSLNERKEDIPMLAAFFLSVSEEGREKVFSEEVLNILTSYNYKGNVRELQNIVLTSAVLSGDETVIMPEHLPDYVKPSKISFKGGLKKAVNEFQREYIKAALEKTGGNITETAKLLEITRQRLYQLIRDLGIKNV